MKRPTLKTIATEMDLSICAVSKIINGKGKNIGLNDKTIAKTLAYADKIGYKPHRQAQNLRLGKTNTLGVILSMPEPDNSDLEYKLFKGISVAAREKSQALMFFDIDDRNSALSAINQCINANVDGVIATHRDDPEYLARLNEAIKQGVRVVMVLNHGKDLLDCPNVVVDHKQGGYTATKYLIDKGYKRIAHLSSRGKPSVGILHYYGYKKALKESNLDYQDELVIDDNSAMNYTGAERLLELSKLPDAVFCWNDRSAVSAQRIFSRAGVDIEVVGFDNRQFVKYMENPFNTVDFPLHKVGKKAVEVIMSGNLSRQILSVAPKLIQYRKN